jgi:hypothetical protein
VPLTSNLYHMNIMSMFLLTTVLLIIAIVK